MHKISFMQRFFFSHLHKASLVWRRDSARFTPIKFCCFFFNAVTEVFLCYFDGGAAMNLSGPMVTNVCVFSLVRLWPSSACHRLYSRWRSLLTYFRQQLRWLTPFTSREGKGERRCSFFPSISRVQVQFVVLWRDYVCIFCIICVENLICNMSNKKKRFV